VLGIVLGIVCTCLCVMHIGIQWRNYEYRVRHCIPMRVDSIWMIAFGAEIVTPPSNGKVFIQWFTYWVFGTILLNLLFT
jgi:hypothetical protein